MNNLAKLLLLLILMSSNICFSQKYSSLEVKDSSFVTFFDKYLKENQPSENLKGVPALFITNQIGNKAEVTITMVAKLSSVVAKLPDNYTYINGRIVLIYDGTQQIFSLSLNWVSELKRLIELDLCDDVQGDIESKLLKKNIETPAFPCAFKYNPFQWKLTFSNGFLIKKEPSFEDLYK